MANVSFIIPPTRYPRRLGYHKYRRHPLIGITDLRGLLLADGHDVQVLDCRTADEPHEYVAQNINKATTIIGFPTLYDSFQFIGQSVKVLRDIAGKALYVAGGPSASGAPEAFLRGAGVDVVVRGEGEWALRMLAQKCAKCPDIPGICFLSDSGKLQETKGRRIVDDLDTLPEIDWSYTDICDAKEIEFMYSIGRGCKNRCAYCLANAKLRRKSPARVKRELLYLQSHYGMTDPILIDSDLFAQKNNLKDFLDVFRDIGLKWGCFTNPQNLTPGFLEYISQAGCANVRVGVESFDEKTLALNRPHISLPELHNSLEALEASSIEKITACLLVGLPGQTDKALENTLEVIEKRPRIIPRPFYMLPLPGSKIFMDACKQGVIANVSDYLNILKDVPIDRYTDLLPNFSNATPKCMQDSIESLMSIADKRSAENQFSIVI